MPTTTDLAEPILALSMQGRTDGDGVPVTDLSGAELRLAAALWSAGVREDSFAVSPNTGMQLTIGAGGDAAVINGDAAGQGRYLVGLAAPLNITLSASDASLSRTDALYLVIKDDTFDASGRVLPLIGYRRGDVGAGAPGPDGTWGAYLLLATVLVGASVTSIESGNITDQRTSFSPPAHTHLWAELTDKPATFTPSAHTHAAGDVTSGTFNAARIPNLDAAKITTGAFGVDRIPSLAASKITSGTFNAARIPNLDGTKITTGTIANTRLPAATTSVSGISQLSSSVASTSTTLSANALAVKTANDNAIAGLRSHTGTSRTITVSTSAPTGGSNGDVWLRV